LENASLTSPLVLRLELPGQTTRYPRCRPDRDSRFSPTSCAGLDEEREPCRRVSSIQQTLCRVTPSPAQTCWRGLPGGLAGGHPAVPPQRGGLMRGSCMEGSACVPLHTCFKSVLSGTQPQVLKLMGLRQFFFCGPGTLEVRYHRDCHGAEPWS
jgi:hypothetical protein